MSLITKMRIIVKINPETRVPRIEFKGFIIKVLQLRYSISHMNEAQRPRKACPPRDAVNTSL
jgi:hypothetical protein